MKKRCFKLLSRRWTEKLSRMGSREIKLCHPGCVNRWLNSSSFFHVTLKCWRTKENNKFLFMRDEKKHITKRNLNDEETIKMNLKLYWDISCTFQKNCVIGMMSYEKFKKSSLYIFPKSFGSKSFIELSKSLSFRSFFKTKLWNENRKNISKFCRRLSVEFNNKLVCKWTLFSHE